MTLTELENTIKKELSLSDRGFNKLFGVQFRKLRLEQECLRLKKATKRILSKIRLAKKRASLDEATSYWISVR